MLEDYSRYGATLIKLVPISAIFSTKLIRYFGLSFRSMLALGGHKSGTVQGSLGKDAIIPCPINLGKEPALGRTHLHILLP